MGIAQATRALEHLLDVFPADLVVLLAGVNDVTWLRGVGREHSFDDPSACNAVDSPWWSKSMLVRRLAWPLSVSTASTSGAGTSQLEWHSANLPIIRERYRALPAIDPEEQPADFALWSSEFEEAVTNAEARGATLLLAGQPTLWKDDLSVEERDRLWFPVRTKDGWGRASPGWLWREMRCLNDAQRAVAEKRHAAFVDLDPLVPKDLVHFFDDCHFTDRGSTRVAQALVPTATRLLSERSQH